MKSQDNGTQQSISSFFAPRGGLVKPLKSNAAQTPHKTLPRRPLQAMTTPEKMGMIRSDSALSRTSQNDGFDDVGSSDTSFGSPEMNNFRNPILSRSFDRVKLDKNVKVEYNFSDRKRGYDQLFETLEQIPRKVPRANRPKAQDNNSDSGDINLSKEQMAVITQIVEKNKNVFYTGSAGTGKSVILRQLVRRLLAKYGTSRVGVTASTGLAACNIGGQTIHRFLGIGIGQGTVDAMAKMIERKPALLRKWRELKVLIVDEVSMIDGVLFAKLCELAKVLRNSNQPFGGIQLVCTGDFFQLPPVSRDGTAQYCFESKTWNEVIHKTILLTKVFRQRSDTELIDMLNALRFGEMDNDMVSKFINLQKPKVYDDGIEPTELFPTRAEVKRANDIRLNNIKYSGSTFTADDSTSLEYEVKLLDNLMCEKTLVLKPGAQVMYLKNRDETIVNGSIGRVLFMCTSTLFGQIEEIYDNEYLNDEALLQEINLIISKVGNNKDWTPPEQIIYNQIPPYRVSKVDKLVKLARLENETQLYPVVSFKNTHGYNSVILVTPEPFTLETGLNRKEITRTQLPLLLSWAMSIHKAQGQTIQRLKVDLQRIFEKGQVYVALSRAVDKNNLEIKNFNPRRIMASDKVKQFYKEMETM